MITDLDLPDGDGIDLVAGLRRRRAVPAIVRSGHATDEDLRRTQAAAFDSHLVKPVGTETLLAAIERATRGSRAVNAS